MQVDVLVNFLSEREPQQNHAKCWLGLLAVQNAFQTAQNAGPAALNSVDNTAIVHLN